MPNCQAPRNSKLVLRVMVSAWAGVRVRSARAVSVMRSSVGRHGEVGTGGMVDGGAGEVID